MMLRTPDDYAMGIELRESGAWRAQKRGDPAELEEHMYRLRSARIHRRRCTQAPFNARIPAVLLAGPTKTASGPCDSMTSARIRLAPNTDRHLVRTVGAAWRRHNPPADCRRHPRRSRRSRRPLQPAPRHAARFDGLRPPTAARTNSGWVPRSSTRHGDVSPDSRLRRRLIEGASEPRPFGVDQCR
jgi:hypothetical protein